MKKINKLNKLKEIVLLLISIILFIIIIKYLKLINMICIILKILIPVFVGFVYSWFFNPLITKLSKKYKRNFICVSLFLIIIALVSLFLYLLIPTVYKEINEVANLLPSFFNMIESKMHSIGLGKSLNSASTFLLENIPIYIIDIVKSLFKYIGVFSVGLVLGLYMSMDYEKMIAGIYKIVPKKYKCIFINLTEQVSNEVRKCINGTLFIAFLVCVGDTLCFYFIGLDAPLLLGMLCGLTDLIPYVGPYIGGAIAVLVGYTESKMLGILTLISCIVVQSIENYILQPMVMSKSIKISPVLIIIGLLVFGNLFGIVGMICATPIVAIIKVISENIKQAIEKCKD